MSLASLEVEKYFVFLNIANSDLSKEDFRSIILQRSQKN